MVYIHIRCQSLNGGLWRRYVWYKFTTLRIDLMTPPLPWRWRHYFRLTHRYISTRLRDVPSHQTVTLRGVCRISQPRKYGISEWACILSIFNKVVTVLKYNFVTLCNTIPKLRYTVKYHPQQSIRCQAGDFIRGFSDYHTPLMFLMFPHWQKLTMTH